MVNLEDRVLERIAAQPGITSAAIAIRINRARAKVNEILRKLCAEKRVIRCEINAMASHKFYIGDKIPDPEVRVIRVKILKYMADNPGAKTLEEIAEHIHGWKLSSVTKEILVLYREKVVARLGNKYRGGYSYYLASQPVPVIDKLPPTKMQVLIACIQDSPGLDVIGLCKLSGINEKTTRMYLITLVRSNAVITKQNPLSKKRHRLFYPTTTTKENHNEHQTNTCTTQCLENQVAESLD